MINRELTEREQEILGMIRPTTFQDMVDAVRRDVERSKYNAKRDLRNLHNGMTGEIANRVTSEIVNRNTHDTKNGRERINISGEICEVSI